ncbi:ECF RNA polymerase sigma factor SigK [Amycolatopsis sp. H20-H5]|uniref:ECF RNA polymerase sigma factor SigK n=1 Tax=Amycolatopsis sp. H20-H5 TaxID=3046309 RepID=UPI002DBD1243|nr:ECF RNA polymerase sigma factor SigK [Amycolatopsis sp. H20-H5]MEC3981290.1 ECF RNA polymerase sigma factor SigK [Amycolatopsis sp. H20-H5]
MHPAPSGDRFLPAVPALRLPGPDELLCSVARGDQAAFEALYDLGAARVFGLIRRVLVDAAQSEEVAQEVWLQVWQHAARFDLARGSAMTWVSTLAHRRAVDRVRSAQVATAREHHASFESARDRPSGHVADSAVSVSTSVSMSMSEQRQVRACLDRLTESQRRSVVMAYYEGNTYQQVGELLGVPVSTVKTRMRDGMIRLRDCLKASEDA